MLGACALAAAAGVLSALALGTGSAVGSPGTTTAPSASTTTRATTTTSPPAPLLVPDGVSIGGVSVGGFAPSDAQHLVETQFNEPLPLVLGARTLLVRPAALGATARVTRAIDRALAAPPGSELPLTTVVNRARVRAYVRSLARGFDRQPQDSRLYLRGLHPFVTKGRAGRALAVTLSEKAIVKRLLENSRAPIVLPFGETPPAVTRETFGPVIVIRRGSRSLWLYRGMRLWRTFRVAVGQPSWPTPLGRFEIVTKWANPWWYPPDSAWARGAAPIPPGPGNPLGTRWLGLSWPGVGIHGTFKAASIGGYASHGCIRMYLNQAEWLFDRVPVGTPVFIVRR